MFTKKYILIIFIVLCSFNFIHTIKKKKQKKTKEWAEMMPSAIYDNPNFIRDRYKNEIWKPMMDEAWVNRFKRPYHPAWMDYCDPYHCNDYHKPACGLNRKTQKFKWFQSGCHVVLNNKCHKYRGTLQYDLVDTKYCSRYVMFLRGGCPTDCPDELDPVCGTNLLTNRVALFINKCAMDRENCKRDNIEKFRKVGLSVCGSLLD